MPSVPPDPENEPSVEPSTVRPPASAATSCPDVLGVRAELVRPQHLPVAVVAPDERVAAAAHVARDVATRRPDDREPGAVGGDPAGDVVGLRAQVPRPVVRDGDGGRGHEQGQEHGRRGGQPAGDGRSRHGTLLQTWSAQHRASVQPHRSSGARRGTGGCRMPPMTASTVVPDRPARRAGVIRRALRREATRIREPKRLAAMLIIAVVFAIAIAGMWARGENAGGDAQAYWAAVRIWLEGGDPYHPTGPFLPYVYAPWMLPLFIPWALLPWDVAWFVWRGGTILLLLWSIRWAYTRRPLPTAILVLILLASRSAGNLDTGNINLLLALALFGAQFLGPKAGGLIWGLATWMKWVPALLWPVLQPRARGWGLVFLALVRAAVAGDAAADDRPAAGAVRLRDAAGPRRLPGVHLGGRAVVVAPPRPVRVPAAVVVARGGRVPARSRAPLVGVVPRRSSGRRPSAPGSGCGSASGGPSGSRTAGGATASPSPRPGSPRRSPRPARSWSGRRRRIRLRADRVPQGGAAQPPGAT